MPLHLRHYTHTRHHVLTFFMVSSSRPWKLNPKTPSAYMRSHDLVGRSGAGFWDITHGRDEPAWEQWSAWGPGIALGPQRAADWWGDTGPPPVNVPAEAKCFFRKVIFYAVGRAPGCLSRHRECGWLMSEINLFRWDAGQLESAWVSLTLRVSTSKRPDTARDKHSDRQDLNKKAFWKSFYKTISNMM